MPAHRPFRIVHLSDLHLTKSDGAERSEPKLFGRLKGMNAAFRKIAHSQPLREADLILVTGDVTDRGDLESWRFFWETLRSAGIIRRTRVVPGNHDVCWLGAVRMPRNGIKDSDIQKAVSGLELAKHPSKFPWVFQPDPRIVAFGLNSNNLGNLSAATNAMGEIGYFQLKALAAKLYQYRETPVKILCLHHSPNIPEAETARRRGQRVFSAAERLAHQIPEGQRHGLLLLSVAHRVRLLLHGHLHMKEDRRITGVRIVGAPSTTEPIPGRGSRAPSYPFFRYTVQGESGRVRAHFSAV